MTDFTQYLTNNEIKRARKRKVFAERVALLRKLLADTGTSVRELSRRMGYRDTTLSAMLSPSALKNRRHNHAAVERAIALLRSEVNDDTN